MNYSYERKVAAADNSWGRGYYPLPPKLSSLGRFAASLAPGKLVDHKFFPDDGVHLLTAKVGHGLSVMADDMKSLLRLGLSRIQCNDPGTLGFYFEGFQGAQPEGGSAPAEEAEPPSDLPINRGGWTVWVTKDRATRWGYSLHNPHGGSSGTGSYTSARAAFAAATGRVNWEGAERLLAVFAKWDPAQAKYVVSKQLWVDIPATGPVPVPKFASEF
jgi:hypothetical protein